MALRDKDPLQASSSYRIQRRFTIMLARGRERVAMDQLCETMWHCDVLSK
ncbi:hypothetical protein HanXRQr2_Chr07g0309971 [Helianthus annuus]|uniref:Uncharacterized protein n=1 Tax=Helianthus annuus TaxID=4232 RepID=A0A9K3NHQ2_HELAN|nr:hypothetical protein HanXRQr2_Chr07g0309971 [Helianthus annuus]KAJ0905964.1 hypothetical protein HanPSC8_Chr07g0300101 [Helianthus annuus]